MRNKPALLNAFLDARDAVEAEGILLEILQGQAEPLIRQIVRSKLSWGATPANMDIDDVCSEALASVICGPCNNCASHRRPNRSPISAHSSRRESPIDHVATTRAGSIRNSTGCAIGCATFLTPNMISLSGSTAPANGCAGCTAGSP